MGLFRASCACDPLTLLIRVASNTRPCSKFGGTTLNEGREEGGERFISQMCDQQRSKNGRFSSQCLVFVAVSGCSERKNRMLKSHHFKESFFSF